MDGSSGGGGRRWWVACGLAALLALVGTDHAEASATKSMRVAARGGVSATARDGGSAARGRVAAARFRRALAPGRIATAAMDRRIERYYARALRMQSATATRQMGMGRFLTADADGLLEDNAVVRYLQFRRELNPRQFDCFHPCMSRILLRDRIARSTRPTTPALPQIPLEPNPPVVLPITPTGPSPQVPVPEPGMLVMGITLAGAGVLAHRRRMRRADE